MNLPDFTLDDRFNTLRQRVGASLSLYKIKINLPKPIRKERPQIVSTPLPELGVEIQGLDELKVNPDGTLGFKGNRVTVHIRDVMKIGGNYHTPRFHVANCRTLEEMRSKGKFERYVVSDRDDDIFHIRIDNGPLKQMSLSVCQNCLDKLSWDGFSSEGPRPMRHQIVAGFNLKKFFAKYPRTLMSHLPTHSVHSAPLNEYPENWDVISAELRRQLRYTCQKCGLQVGEQNKRYLHIHHRNSIRYDVSPDNLECLCIRCHADQPDHGHVRNTQDYRAFLVIFPG